MSTCQHTRAQNTGLGLATHLKYVLNCPSAKPKDSRASLAIVSLLTEQNLNAYTTPFRIQVAEVKTSLKAHSCPSIQQRSKAQRKIVLTCDGTQELELGTQSAGSCDLGEYGWASTQLEHGLAMEGRF